MTGLYDRTPGVGHNHPHDHSRELENENQQWDRWAKKRTFVRALTGTYSHLYKELVDEPRVYSSKRFSVEGRARPLRQAHHQPAHRRRSRSRSRPISRSTRQARTARSTAT